MTRTSPSNDSIMHIFHSVNAPVQPKSGASSRRITLRLTEEEYAQLTAEAGGMTVSSYVRQRLFGEDASFRKSRQRVPVKDQQALAQVLGKLGETRMASNLNQIARQANCGTLLVDEELEQELKVACARIAWIRVKLIEALGLKGSDCAATIKLRTQRQSG